MSIAILQAKVLPSCSSQGSISAFASLTDSMGVRLVSRPSKHRDGVTCLRWKLTVKGSHEKHKQFRYLEVSWRVFVQRVDLFVVSPPILE